MKNKSDSLFTDDINPYKLGNLEGYMQVKELFGWIIFF